jgi:antitoxin (DNA-binding transcriptional repressor) of toxin-antitoxin stability system
MAGRSIEAADVPKMCYILLRLIKRDGEPITITRNGEPILILSPAQESELKDVRA